MWPTEDILITAGLVTLTQLKSIFTEAEGKKHTPDWLSASERQAGHLIKIDTMTGLGFIESREDLLGFPNDTKINCPQLRGANASCPNPQEHSCGATTALGLQLSYLQHSETEKQSFKPPQTPADSSRIVAVSQALAVYSCLHGA